MRIRVLFLSACFFAAITVVFSDTAYAATNDTHLSVSSIKQDGTLPEGSAQPGLVVFANEPDGGKAGLILEFDLESVPDSFTPSARLQLADVERLKVKRSGQTATSERNIMQIFYRNAKTGEMEFAGCQPTKAGGITNSYTIDVTPAVNDALSKPAGQKKLSMELRLEGKPVFFEVYGVATDGSRPMPGLDIAPSGGWKNDWEKRIEPVMTAAEIYREACLPLAETAGQELELKLLYPAGKITEVLRASTGEKFEQSRDWILRGGKLFIPSGSRIPVQLASEFFMVEHKEKDGTVKKIPSSIKLVPGIWYQERQIEVSYEPSARPWKFAPPLSSLDQLPRIKKLLAEKEPVTVVLFGDSIAAGGDTSGLHGVWPYQPGFGELAAWKLQKNYGSKVTFINTARAGATSDYATKQAEAQVGWFKPDLAILAYGMNDRSDARRVNHKANMEKVIDTIRAASPDTEFILVTSMLNSPKQSTGLDPIKFIRDEALSISRPGLAFADITSTHLEMINHKDYLDISGNGANHPNDFLHRIYAQRILEVLIPENKK
jgi:hypothetical protein